MRFHNAGNYVSGQADPDPVTNPSTTLPTHIFIPRETQEKPKKLQLLFWGNGSETLTVSLYYLLEEQNVQSSRADLVSTDSKWVQFYSTEVLEAKKLKTITQYLPAGGIIYVRRTDDTIAGGETRKLLFAWQ